MKTISPEGHLLAIPVFRNQLSSIIEPQIWHSGGKPLRIERKVTIGAELFCFSLRTHLILIFNSAPATLFHKNILIQPRWYFLLLYINFLLLIVKSAPWARTIRIWQAYGGAGGFLTCRFEFQTLLLSTEVSLNVVGRCDRGGLGLNTIFFR